MQAALLGGLAASLASTGMQIAANSEVKSNEEDAINAELARQQGYQQQSSRAFLDSTTQANEATANKEIAAGQNTAESAYNKYTAPLATSGGPGATTPTSTVANNQAEQVNQQIAQSNLSRSKLSGYTEWDLAQWIKNLRSQQAINLINTKAQAQESTLPYYLLDAQHSADDLKTGASVASALGSVLSVAGMTAAPTAAAGNTGAFSSLIGNAAKSSSSNDISSDGSVNWKDFLRQNKTISGNNYSPIDWSPQMYSPIY